MWFGFRIFLVLITRLVWIFWKGRWFAEERSTVETLRQPSAKGVWRAYRERVASLVNTTSDISKRIDHFFSHLSGIIRA